MPDNLEAKVVFLLDRSEEEIQAIDGHPAVRWASKQILKALEAITGWRMRIPESIVPSTAVGGSLPLPGSPFSCLPCCQTFLLAARARKPPGQYPRPQPSHVKSANSRGM